METIYLLTHWSVENCDDWGNDSVIESMQPYSTLDKAKYSVENSRYWGKEHKWLKEPNSPTYTISNCVNEYKFEIEAILLEDWFDNPLEEI